MARKGGTGLDGNPQDGYSITNRDGIDRALTIIEETEEAMREEVENMKALRRAVCDYMESQGLETYASPTGQTWRYVQSYRRIWIGTDAEIPRNLIGQAKSLKSIVAKRMVERKGKKPTKLWNLITKRVPDPEMIDLAVRSGWITEQEIAKAYIERPNAPYIRPGAE